MRFTYDPEVDILMVHLVSEDQAAERFARSERIEGGMVVDRAADGTAISIEIMGAARRYGADAVSSLPMEGIEPISLGEAASISGLSIDALKQAAQRGRLLARKIGRNWATTERELSQYLNSRMHAGPGSAGENLERQA